MFAALARLANTHPRRVLALTVLFFALAGAFGGPVASLLNSDNDSFSDTGAESAKALERIETASGEMATPDLIAVLPSGDAGALDETLSILRSEENVAQVAGGPESGPAFVSKDGAKTYVVAVYKIGRASLRSLPAVAYVAIWNVAGNPAAAVPCGIGPDGLPLSVQLVGRPDDETTLISLSAQLERARPWPLIAPAS